MYTHMHTIPKVEHRTLDPPLVSIPLARVSGQDLSMLLNQNKIKTYLERHVHSFLLGLKPERMLGLELQATSCYHVMLDVEANMTEGRVKRWRETKS